MKIKKDIYESMRSDIKTVADSMGIDIRTADSGKTGLKTMWGLLSIVSRDRAYDDKHPLFANGSWKRILPHDGREYCFYYAEGCHDEHVATALKNIKEELI